MEQREVFRFHKAKKERKKIKIKGEREREREREKEGRRRVLQEEYKRKERKGETQDLLPSMFREQKGAVGTQPNPKPKISVRSSHPLLSSRLASFRFVFKTHIDSPLWVLLIDSAIVDEISTVSKISLVHSSDLTV